MDKYRAQKSPTDISDVSRISTIKMYWLGTHHREKDYTK